MTGYDISDDEMAKSHARYMIGGASDVPNERIFRFGARSQVPSSCFCATTAFPFGITNHAQADAWHFLINFFFCHKMLILRLGCSIEFPERPGALRKFLTSLRNMGWNISLFHYRNQGAGTLRPLASPNDRGN